MSTARDTAPSGSAQQARTEDAAPGAESALDDEWDPLDQSDLDAQFDMVAFELYGKAQMKRFFGSVWFLIAVTFLYVIIYLGHSVGCVRNETFEDAFHHHVKDACTANHTLPSNVSAIDYWQLCCEPFNGVGNSKCFEHDVDPHMGVSSASYETCCVLQLAQALNSCENDCSFQLVDAIVRVILGILVILGLLIYGVRFCRNPHMRRFEQKFVLGLFFLCVLMTNPYSASSELLRRAKLWSQHCVQASEIETPAGDTPFLTADSFVVSIGCTVFAATTYGFCIVFLMSYRASTKIGEHRTSCFRSMRSLGPRYVLFAVLLSLYIVGRVILSSVVRSFAFMALHSLVEVMSCETVECARVFDPLLCFRCQATLHFYPVSLGCVPLLPPLLSLVRLCALEPVPDFARFYLNMLSDVGVSNSSSYVGKCTDSPGTLCFVVSIFILDLLLFYIFANEARRTRKKLLSFGYAQSRTLQVRCVPPFAHNACW